MKAQATEAVHDPIASATGAAYVQPVAPGAAAAVYVHPPALSHVEASPAVKLQSTDAVQASATAVTAAV